MTLSHLQYAILSALGQGGRVESVRIYPFPHKHQVVRNGRCEEVGERSQGALTHAGILRAVPKDAAWDCIVYELTDAGRAAMTAYAVANPDRVQRLARREAGS